MSTGNYILKIIGGANQGAEVGLRDGEELVIGNGMECDLIIGDSLLAGRHLRIKVDEVGVVVTPLEGGVYVSGEEVGKDPVRVEWFKVISYGTTHMVMGPDGVEWPGMTAADIPALKKLVVEEVSEEGKGEGVEEGVNLEGASKLEEGGGSGIEGVDTEIKEEVEEEKGYFSKKRWMVIGGVVGVVLLGSIGIYMMSGGGDELVHMGREVKGGELMRRLQGSLNELGLGEEFRLEERGGKVVMEGWVRDMTERAVVEDLVKGYGERVEVKVYSQKQILDSVVEMLTALNVPLKVDAGGLGRVRIYGYYGDSSGWERLKGDIQRDVPGIRELKDEVVSGIQLQAIIRKLMEENGLGGKVEVIAQSDAVLLRGRLSPSDVGNLKEVMLLLQDQIGVNIPVRSEMAVLEAEKAYFDAQIDRVVIGKEAYVVTRDGERFFRGGVLPGGFIIENINRESIMLRRGQQSVTLKIGEEI